MKTCNHCSQTKPLSEFYVHRQGVNGPIHKSRCKPCENEHNMKRYYARSTDENRAIRQKSREKIGTRGVKNYTLKHKYGITIEQYEEMYEAQYGRCFICEDPHDVLCVDHHHASGKVRKLLCKHCNSMIGHAKESITVLMGAIDYLREHE